MPARHLPRPEIVLARQALGVDFGLAGVGGASLLDCFGDEGRQLWG